MKTTGWAVEVIRYWGVETVPCNSKREAAALAKRITREQDRDAKAVFLR